MAAKEDALELLKGMLDPTLVNFLAAKAKEKDRRVEEVATDAIKTRRNASVQKHFPHLMMGKPETISVNHKTTENQSKMSTIQERARQFEIQETKAVLAEQITAHKVKIDPKDTPKVELQKGLRKIVVPESMNKLQAAHTLIKQFEEEETLRTYNRSYGNFFLNDFLITVQTLIPKYFGMLHVSKYDTNGRAAGQDYLQFPVGFNPDGTMRTEKGYIGSILAPVWEQAILDIHPGAIAVRAKMKFEEDVNEFLADVEESIKKNSVVKSTSVTISAVKGGLIATPINPKENKTIILDDKVGRVINNLIIPGLKEKSKTSLLFTGDFGTGKTETALKVGLMSQKKFGRTFFYLHNSELFSALIPYIKNYQAATIFVEDVDQISSGDRDSAMNNLLNQLDGNELKGIDCTFIFTTNNHDKIHPAMRRPGRIDQVVHFDYCTVDQIAKIFAVYAEGREGADTVDYMKAAKEAPGNLQGAVVAEIARRAIRYAEHLYDGIISTDRFLDAIASMEHHIKFMRQDQKKDHTAEGLLGHIFYKSLTKAFPKLGTDIEDFAGSPYQGLDA